MRLIPLEDGTLIEWEPTTDLLCTCCRIPIDVVGDPKEALAWTNFMYDLAHPKETSLVLGDYWYLHKRCMGIEDALMRRGARITWGWHDMKSVLGLDSAPWKQMCGNVQKALQQRMPRGVYDRLYHQWLPALQLRLQQSRPPRGKRVLQPKPSHPGKPGIVYLIQAQGDPPIKIGRGVNAIARLKQLQTGNPRKLVLLREIAHPEHDKLEKQLHARYNAFNVEGEWFALPPDVLEALLKEDFI